MSLNLQGLGKGIAEVPLYQSAHEAEVLHVQGFVQAPAASQLVQVGLVGADLAVHLHRISRQTDHAEDDGHQQPQGDEAIERAGQDIPCHDYSFTCQSSQG